MTTEQYLRAVLSAQSLSEISDEMDDVRKNREEVKKIIRAAFPGAELYLRDGGSKAKHTMIRESYDYDLICNAGADEETLGRSLEDIYNNVADALRPHFFVDPRRTSLRLMTGGKQKQFLHIDVVPGRYTDDTRGDAFLHQNEGLKERLKTNLDKHIEHVRDSGLTDEIKLLKYWRWCNGFKTKTFVLELLAIKLLSPIKDKSHAEQLLTFWNEVSDHTDTLSVEDPANPNGNDLTGILDEARYALKVASQSTLQTIAASGWETVFGPPETADPKQRESAVVTLPSSRPSGARPWST